MKNNLSRTKSTQKLQRYLAIIGMIICLVAVAIIWQAISAYQSMWPLPGLYFVEMIAACGVGMWSIWSIESSQSLLRGFLVWVVVGILFAFIFMGAASVGFLFMPVAVLFAIAAILVDRRETRYQLHHMGVAVAAALIQAVLMVVIVQLL